MDNSSLDYGRNGTIPYASFSALREAHTRLLKSHLGGESEEVLAEADTFLRQAKATGALLDSDHDRVTSQSLMDYWVTILYRAKRTPPDSTLDEFDPSLAPSLDDSACPYVGLNAFQEMNKDAFFGRQTVVNHMMSVLRQTNLLFAVGPSGSGKSSVVLAGVQPALRAGGLPESENWRYFKPMVPGSSPLRNLAMAMNGEATDRSDNLREQVDEFKRNHNHLRELLSDPGRLPGILIIDQFEEVFTLCTDESVRACLIENIIRAANAPGSSKIILTMRTDLQPQLVLFPELMKLTEQGEVAVKALTATDLNEAIDQPARRVGLKFADGIVAELVRDILGEVAGLPLLQFALLRLWKVREKNRVTWEAFRKLGNPRVALGRAADELHSSLILEDQRTAKSIFLCLVRPGEFTNEFTSNRVRRAALYRQGFARDRVDRVLEKLVTAGLLRLTSGEIPERDQIEVAHEALVRNWSTLVDWLDEERSRLRQRLRLTTAADQWLEHDKDPGGLLGGSLLDEALTYEDLNALEEEFVNASVAAVQQAEAEKEAVRKRERELEDARVLAVHQRAEEVAKHAARIRRFAMVLAIVAVAAVVFAAATVVFALGARAQRSKAILAAGVAKEQATLASEHYEDAKVARENAELRRVEAERAGTLANERLIAAKKAEAQAVDARRRADLERKRAQSQTQQIARLLNETKKEKDRADDETSRVRELTTQLQSKVDQLNKLNELKERENQEVEARDELNRTATMILRQSGANQAELNDAVAKLTQVRVLYQKHSRRDGEEDTLNALTQAYRKLNDDSHAQTAYDQAMAMYQEDINTQQKSILPESALIAPGFRRLADFYRSQGQNSKAIAVYKQTLSDIGEKLSTGKVQEGEIDRVVDQFDHQLGGLADIYRQQNDYDELESLYEENFELKNKILKPGTYLLYAATNDMARVYRDQKKFAEAEPYLVKAREMAEKALGPDDSTYVFESLRNLGSLYRDERKYDNAEPVYEKALSNLQQSSKKSNIELVTDTLNDLAGVYQKLEKYERAESLYQQSITFYQQLPAKSQKKLNATQTSLADVYRNNGKLRESEELYSQVVTAMKQESKGQDSPELASTLAELGDVKRKLRKFDEAEELYRSSLNIYQKDAKKYSSNIAATYVDLMSLYHDQGKSELVADYYKRAKQVPRGTVDSLVQFFADQGEYEEAGLIYDQELATRKRTYGSDNIVIYDLLNQAGRFFREHHRYPEAERYYSEGRDLMLRTFGPNDAFYLVSSLNNLATTYHLQKKNDQAEALYKQALANLEKGSRNQDPLRTAETLEKYAEVLQDMGRGEEAEKLKDRAKALRQSARL